MAVLLLLLALLGIGVVTSAPGGLDPAPLRPPALELRSEGGTQRAAQGSYCVTGEGSGECVDFAGPVVPKRASVVRPGEVVTLVFVGADAVDGAASVRRLGCDEELRSLPLEAETRWKVDVAPGAYEIVVEAVAFEAGSASGDTSGGLGLVVAADAPLAVRPAGRPVVCPVG